MNNLKGNWEVRQIGGWLGPKWALRRAIPIPALRGESLLSSVHDYGIYCTRAEAKDAALRVEREEAQLAQAEEDEKKGWQKL